MTILHGFRGIKRYPCMVLESIIFYLLLIDALGANLLAWSGGRVWWQQHMGFFARYLPLTQGWALYYLFLVLLFGALLMRHGLIIFPW
jgi:hypothetical protein